MYGPNLQGEMFYGGCRDYDVDLILELVRLKKKFPEGIPCDDDDN